MKLAATHFVVEKSKRRERPRPAIEPVITTRNLSRISHVHIIGIAYKRDVDDVREPPAIDIIHLLRERGARATYTGPQVPSLRIDGMQLFFKDPGGILAQADCVVIVTDHSSTDL